MDTNYVITFMSKEWIIANSISFLYIFLCLYIGKSLTKQNAKTFAKIFVSIFIFSYVIYHLMHIIDGTWSLNKRLPFHLCGFSSVISFFILFIDKKQIWFEFLFYAGVLGGLNALLTPVIDDYTGTTFFYLEYFYSHTSIIILPLFMFYYMDMRLSRYSWLRAFFIINLLLLIIMPIDFMIDANYMYLKEPPPLDHPLISGEWPYYLINLEFIVLLLLFLTYHIFNSTILRNKLKKSTF